MTDREPLAIRTAVVAAAVAIVHLLVLLGVWNLDAEQEAQLALVLGLVGSVVVVLWTRGKVTPVDDPKTDNGTPLVPAPVKPDASAGHDPVMEIKP